MVFGKKAERHSDRAKKGTSEQLDGIINFLQKQIESYEKEMKLYSDKVFSQFREGIENNISIAKKSIEYYKNLKDEYSKQGLI